MKSFKPNKQRKKMFNAPQHKKRKQLASHLDENLILKYDKRAVPVIKGDTIRVMRGNYKGHEDKVSKVNVKKYNIEIEGITMAKADGNKIAKPIHPSNVIITKLNLTDKWRRRKLEKGLSAEAKKEIEKEAEEQIKEQEEEQKKLEEEKAKEEKEKSEDEEVKETEEEKTEKKTEESKDKEKTKETKKSKKEETKKEPKKKTKSKPKKEKKEKTKKTTKKKTTTKTKKKSSTNKKEGK